MPSDNAEAVDKYMDVIYQLAQSDKFVMDNFIADIIDTGFLKNIQKDCLKIYPQILEKELPLKVFQVLIVVSVLPILPLRNYCVWI